MDQALRYAKYAWRFGASVLFAVLFFFMLVEPARAPKGGKQSLGGRTIASLQEEDFDRRLLQLQLCFGVRVVADDCTLERRRVCKALVVHHLEAALAKPGNYLKDPVEFHCEDTAFGNAGSPSEEGLIALKPNGEKTAILGALERNVSQLSVTANQDRAVREACEFLTDCKWAMRPQAFSLRKLASCVASGDSVHRRIVLDEVGAMLFHARQGRYRALYSDLIDSVGE